jgi:hypothetical protein
VSSQLANRPAPGAFASWGHCNLKVADLWSGHAKARALKWSAQGKSIRSIAVALQMSEAEIAALLEPTPPDAA